MSRSTNLHEEVIRRPFPVVQGIACDADASGGTPRMVPTQGRGSTRAVEPPRAARATAIQLSLVVPTYNERENLEAVLARVCEVLDERLPNAYELIVVDDDSPDRTWELAEALAERNGRIRVVRRTHERGLATAVGHGWRVARGQALGVIDADLQHPPEVLSQLLDAVENGADLAVASRHIEGGGVSDWSIPRRLLSRGAQALGLLMLPEVIGRVSDPMSGFFLVRRDALQGAKLAPIGYKILIEVIAKANIRRISEVGYVFNVRQLGDSKVSRRQYVDYLRHLWLLRRSKPLGWVSLFDRLPVTRLMKFGAVGLTGVFVDMVVLYLLSDPSALALGLTRSKVVAAEVAILNNFIWNDRWTFRDKSRHQPGVAAWSRRFLKFNAICLVGLAINVLILNVLFNGVGMNRYVANLIAIGVVMVWNFAMNLGLNWRSTAAVPRPT